MSDELRAAAEEVCREARRIDHYTPTITIPTSVLLSAAAVACNWRAEHPADDGEPTTEEWLESLGRRGVPGFGVPLTPLLSLWNSSSGWHLFFHNGDGDGFMPDMDTNGPIRIAGAGTRGQVRRLLAALGISTNS